MLTAYFDESGRSLAGPYFVLAAFVADEGAWHTFAPLWTKALDDTGAPYLHMREFAHSIGPFTAWRKDEPRRRRLLKGCVDALRAVRPTAVAAIMGLDDFREIERWADHDPYFFAFQEAVRGAAIEAEFATPSAKTNMVFSRLDEFASDARRLYGRLGKFLDVRDHLGALKFADMRTEPALQAADLLAYELYHYCSNKTKRASHPLRWALQQIVEMQADQGDSMLKQLPRWYLRVQAMDGVGGTTPLMLSNPNLYRFFLEQFEVLSRGVETRSGSGLRAGLL